MRVFVNKNAYKLTACALIMIMIPSFLAYIYQVNALWMPRPISSYGAITQNRVGNLTQLHIEGKYVKNSAGQTVFLRGVNVATYLNDATGWWYTDTDFGYGDWNETRVRQHLSRMQKIWGINSIRILIYIEWWKNNYQGTFDGKPTNRPYRDCLKDTIVLAQKYGIYVIITPWGVGVPDTPSQPQLPWPPHTSRSDVIPNTQAFIDFWVNVTTELKNYPNVLFELYNEPAGYDAEQTQWFSVAQQTINAIRAVTDHIIIIQWGYCAGVQWLRRSDLPKGTNVLYSEHIYRVHGSLYNNGYTYDQVYDALHNDHSGWLGDYQYAVTNNIPMWIGEIGSWIAYDPDPLEKEAFANTLKVLNEWEMGYSIWEWFVCPGRPFGVLQTTNVPTPNVSGQILIDAIANASI